MATKTGKGKTGKGKRPAAESSSGFNTERFKDAGHAELFESQFINRTVIFERIVVQDGLTDTGFMQYLRNNHLVTLSSLTNECFEDWVREFYCNMFDVNDSDFKTYVLGKILYVDVNMIATLLRRPRPDFRSYPIDEEHNIVIPANEVATVLSGRPFVWNTPLLKIFELNTDYRLLNTFVCHNIEHRSHKSDLQYFQAFLLYSLGTGTSVDIPLTILKSMLRVSYESRKITLLFDAIICKLMMNAGCQAYSHELPVSKRQRIDARTMARSDTHVCRHLQGGQAQVQADDAEEDFIENRLSSIKNVVFDQSAQIEQLEKRVTTGFSDIRNQLDQIFNQLRHQ